MLISCMPLMLSGLLKASVLMLPLLSIMVLSVLSVVVSVVNLGVAVHCLCRMLPLCF